ncbi:hypothetical protein NFI96_031094 [Prochilodus magdalenae]|nr:hypothetical protein NFI96_031094 [Prochilodus magdalenae]
MVKKHGDTMMPAFKNKEKEMRMNRAKKKKTCESDGSKEQMEPAEQQLFKKEEKQSGQTPERTRGDNTWDATASVNKNKHKDPHRTTTEQDLENKDSDKRRKKKDSNIKIPEAICRLALKNFYTHRLTTEDALKIFYNQQYQIEKEPINENNLAFVYLYKLLTLDYRARCVTINKKNVTTEIGATSGENEDFDDFLNDVKEHDNSIKDGNTQIHPMDVQMAVFHCADSFLRQNMVTKLSSCQYALPLLVPSPTSTNIEFPLWNVSGGGGGE